VRLCGEEFEQKVTKETKVPGFLRCLLFVPSWGFGPNTSDQ
jgi:hypothetical protein